MLASVSRPEMKSPRTNLKAPAVNQATKNAPLIVHTIQPGASFQSSKPTATMPGNISILGSPTNRLDRRPLKQSVRICTPGAEDMRAGKRHTDRANKLRIKSHEKYVELAMK